VGPLPPSDQDLGMVFIESQCLAVPADADDELLVRWDKLQVPFLKLPPKHDMYCLTGWRDPFIFYCSSDKREGGQSDYKYKMLIGSGVKDKGGTALVYGSARLEDGWELLGLLCEGNHAEDETGIVWECPLVVPLTALPPEQPELGGGSEIGARRRAAPRWLWQSDRKQTSAQRLSSADLVLERACWEEEQLGAHGSRCY
jgi:sucrose-6-phosphate hydrolase SacC (GH32 family)